MTLSDSESSTQKLNRINYSRSENNIELEIEDRINDKRKTAVAWLCFDLDQVYEKNGANYIKCNQLRCGKELKVVKSTSSNLSMHVKKMHGHLLQDKKRKTNQATILFSANQSVLRPFTPALFKEYIVDLFVVQDFSFLTIETPQFIKLIKLLRPETTMFKADALKKEILERFRITKIQIIKFFSSIKSRVSFTTDIWTSPNDLSFMAITAHWISPQFVVQSLLVDFLEIQGSHTGVNIEKYFSESLIEFGLFDKKLAVTLDNAYNNDTFISSLIKRDPSFTKDHHIRCFGHILNITSQDALKLVQTQILTIRNYIKRIIHSPKNLARLKDYFDELGKTTDFVKPILDVVTRWNSTVDMIQRAIRLKSCLDLTMNSMFHEEEAKRRHNDGTI